MIIVPKKNLYLPERKWGQKKFQRGIICATAVYGGDDWVVTLTDTNIWNFVSGGTTLFINADGTLDITTFVARHQENAATDWIIPNDAASSSFEVRYINLTGDALYTEWAAENVWIAISTDRWCGQFSGPPGKTSDIDVEIRKNGGAALDLGHFQFMSSSL